MLFPLWHFCELSCSEHSRTHFHVTISPFLWNKSQRVQFLPQTVVTCLVFEGTAKLFSRLHHFTSPPAPCGRRGSSAARQPSLDFPRGPLRFPFLSTNSPLLVTHYRHRGWLVCWLVGWFFNLEHICNSCSKVE